MSSSLLPDAAARESILNDLDLNLVVEAAAGTGKTTCLVGRILNLIRKGALSGPARLAAVTFTHKAAAELRERLEARLNAALRETAVSERERRLLSEAAAALPECHIGTIHAFCARLLRERPVEAGVAPDFAEIDDTADLALRRRAWNEFAEAMRQGRHRRLYETFQQFELDQDALGDGFVVFADYPDIDVWEGSEADVGGIDVGRFVRGVADFHGDLRRFRDDLDDIDCGNDELLPLMRVLCRRFPRLERPVAAGDAYRLGKLFREEPRLVQKQWRALGLEGDEAKERLAAYKRFWEESVRPFREQCLAAIYGAAVEAFIQARDVYDRLRRERNVLNFQDLLMATAAMLRDYPEVRTDMSERYPRLLVDEVQDTDPVQAEILFLLASSDPRQRDWRLCPPRPGSLFIVGDPKQSIYRFRRADIVVYQEAKRLVAGTGGRVLGLSSNFRGQPDVLDWVNRTFGGADADAGAAAVAASGRFSPEESAYGPAYVPLRPGLPPTPPGGFHGVFRLETIPADRKEGVSEQAIVRDEARRIAAFIRDAVDRGLPIPTGKGLKPAEPGDFLIVTYQKAPAPLYAEALRALGLDCLVSSGGTLSGSRPLALLLEYLLALANPMDPVRLLAVLRGGLFGVADTELYRWKKAGGSFCFLDDVPDAAPSPIREIVAAMREHWRLANRTHPALAAGVMADDLGLWALACLEEDPSVSAGAFAAALELVKAERLETATLAGLAARLAWHLDNHEQDPPPAREWPGQAVRIMNLHKTKGLEAPVVFLAGTRTVRGRPASFAVRRGEGGVGAGMAIRGGEYGNVVLARPAGWEDMAAEEELFLAAERTRLNYVAATRAGAALVVSMHQAGKTWKSAFLPDSSSGDAIETPLPEPAEPPRAGARDLLEDIDAAALESIASRRAAARSAMLGQTFRTAAAKPENAGAGSEAALALGEVVHRLLDDSGPDGEREERAARLLRDFELPLAMLDETLAMVESVRRSELWKRAAASERVFRETPFAVRLRRDGEMVLQRGVVDLVFKEADGWIVADYKTDRLPEGVDPAVAAERHAEQVDAYARAWERITGERVVEKGVYFLRSGRYAVLSDEKAGPE